LWGANLFVLYYYIFKFELTSTTTTIKPFSPTQVGVG
jgi:hypothetical protein